MIDTNKVTEVKEIETSDEPVSKFTVGGANEPITKEKATLSTNDVQPIGISNAPQTQSRAAIVKPNDFDGITEKAAEVLAKVPGALDFGTTDSDKIGKYFAYVDNSKEAVSVRKELQGMLKDLYQGGMYSHGDIAARLRVEPMAVYALIDPNFKDDNNLMIHESLVLKPREPKEAETPKQEKAPKEEPKKEEPKADPAESSKN